jgi:hypothetical protein
MKNNMSFQSGNGNIKFKGRKSHSITNNSNSALGSKNKYGNAHYVQRYRGLKASKTRIES